MVPFAIIYINNWIIFVVILVSLFRKRNLVHSVGQTDKSKELKAKLRQQFIVALTLSLLFGLGWGVGFIATTSIPVPGVLVPLQAFFIVLTGLQGPLIFIMQCARSEDARNEWMRWVHIVTRNSLSDSSSKKTSSEDQYKYPSSSAKYMHGYSSDAEKRGNKRFSSNKQVANEPALSAVYYARKEEKRLSAQEQFALDSFMKEDLSLDQVEEEEGYEDDTQLNYYADDEDFEMPYSDVDLSFPNSLCDMDDGAWFMY